MFFLLIILLTYLFSLVGNRSISYVLLPIFYSLFKKTNSEIQPTSSISYHMTQCLFYSYQKKWRYHREWKNPKHLPPYTRYIHYISPTTQIIYINLHCRVITCTIIDLALQWNCICCFISHRIKIIAEEWLCL